ncbi:MAG: DUF1559 domain-containing protein [Planctomycetes bacterium]|nr:DUF1559 domain-containing protein [Planctomycetota bacterium]
MFNSWPRTIAVLLLGVILSGCGKGAAPAPATTGKDEIKPVLMPTPSESEVAIRKAPADGEKKPTVPAAVTQQRATVPFADADYLGEDVVGIVVAHPRRLTAWPLYQSVKSAGMLDQVEQQAQEFNLKPETMERVTVVIDQTTVNQAAGAAGLQVSDKAVSAATAKLEATNHLKFLAIGLHNYHDANSAFPRADGDAAGMQTGLSWRVHLLPMLNMADLYDEFKLDEPWDSEHNKTLIEKMPEIFSTPGVTDAGKTSIHVIVDEKSPFHGKKGISLLEITDGSSNTLLAVMAGADTAEIWTKPGGLTMDPAAPKKCLGDVKDSFLAAFCDGSVRPVKTQIDDEMFVNLVQMNDENAVSLPESSSRPVPNMILTLVEPADQLAIIASLLGTADEEEFEGQKIHKNDMAAVCFTGENTVLAGTLELVKKMIMAKQSGKPGTSKVLPHLASNADFALALDVNSQASITQQAAMLNPMLGIAQQIKTVSLQLNVTGGTGDPLLELIVTAANSETAKTISQFAELGLGSGKQNAAEAISMIAEPELREMFTAVVNSAAVTVDQDRATFAVPVPKDFDKLPELLAPHLKVAAEQADQVRRRNALKQIGLAFHNYLDTNRTFPGAGSSAAGKTGLSWRVHILPFVDQGTLYTKFNLDEPWDSETNKPLIGEMPKLFKSPGITEPGKTSYHVFTGPGALFADDAQPGFASITDGSAMTILAVEAGPDAAEIWTKPGGLDFDPKNPIKALGKVGESILVLMADGAVRSIPDSIPPKTLRQLIQSQDGETIEGF